MEALQRAIERAGGQAALANVMNVTPQAVSQWVHSRRPIPLSRAIAIEQWSGGAITRAELRPDIFGYQAA
jgi:DNA-binding transcriptional regulator YdaS (Cro superfamily)